MWVEAEVLKTYQRLPELLISVFGLELGVQRDFLQCSRVVNERMETMSVENS